MGFRRACSPWLLLVLAVLLSLNCGRSKNSHRSGDVIPEDELEPSPTPFQKPKPFDLTKWNPGAYLTTNTPHQFSDATPTLIVRGTVAGHSISIYSDSACEKIIATKVTTDHTTKVTLPTLKAGLHTWSIVAKTFDKKSSRCFANQLKYVYIPSGRFKNIVARKGVFAALRDNGSVECWGDFSEGLSPCITQAHEIASGVVSVHPTQGGFFAIKNDGKVIPLSSTWNLKDSQIISLLKKGIRQAYLYNSNSNIAAYLLNDDTLVAWKTSGVTNSYIEESVSKAVILSTSLAVLKKDGSVQLFDVIPDLASGVLFTDVENQLTSEVTDLVGTTSAVAALKQDGSVVTWGNSTNGGDSSAVASELVGVQSVHATSCAFAALRSDGSVVAWGSSTCGGDASAVASELSSGVISIHGNNKAFAAKKADGSVVAWGNSSLGGQIDVDKAGELAGFDKIIPVTDGFVATNNDLKGLTSWGSVQLPSGIDLGEVVIRSVVDLVSSSTILTTLGQVFQLTGTDRFYNAIADKVKSGVRQVVKSTDLGDSYAALKDGGIVTWGGQIGEPQTNQNIGMFRSGIIALAAQQDFFAALRANGSVFLWDGYNKGSVEKPIADLLSSDVVRLQSFPTAVIVHKKNGTVLGINNFYRLDKIAKIDFPTPVNILQAMYVEDIWGNFGASLFILASNGRIYVHGDADAKAEFEPLRKVKRLEVLGSRIAAFTEDGKGVYFSKSDTSNVGFLDAVESGVKDILFLNGTEVVLKQDGSVETFGSAIYGGDSSAVADKLTSGVVEIVGLNRGVLARKDNGEIVIWGSDAASFDIEDLQQLGNASEIQKHHYGIFGRKDGGSYVFVPYKDTATSATTLEIKSHLQSNVKQLGITQNGIAVLKSDGSIKAFESQLATIIPSELTRPEYERLYISDEWFVAKRKNGTVTAWGRRGGAKAGFAAYRVGGVKDIVSTAASSAALLDDGSVVTWGSQDHAGDLWAKDLGSP